jgi:aldose 1-epimerase
VQTSGSHLRAGDLEARFLPDLGMVCVSLRHRAEELLGLVDELDRYERQGSTLGIPLLHPWANRLAGFRYAAGGTEVLLDSRSPLLHFDEHGLPIHGIPGARLAWKVVDAHGDFVRAVLDWNTDDLLAVFPYPHTLEMTVRLSPSDLEIETALAPIGKVPVPVSFGFHPYLALPGTARAEWIVELPAMARLVLDESGIPTGDEKPFPGLHGGSTATTTTASPDYRHSRSSRSPEAAVGSRLRSSAATATRRSSRRRTSRSSASSR